VVPLPDEDAVLVSMRHQDAVVRLDGPDGDLRWILANPDGWDAEHAALRLAPAGDVAWTYHQHAPMVDADGEITLFDNGNHARTTPYSASPDPAGDYTRLVRFAVDTAAGTVRQTWSYAPSAPLFAQALGNADRLPRTGNTLGTFPWLLEEDGVSNLARGEGERSARVLEVADDGSVVWDLRVSVPGNVSSDGVLFDRAIRVPTLYGPDVVEETW
jgi:hypothetical protein